MTPAIIIRPYPGVTWNYATAADAQAGLDYMQDDVAYLEKALAGYKAAGDTFMVGKVTLSLENSRRIVALFTAALPF